MVAKAGFEAWENVVQFTIRRFHTISCQDVLLYQDITDGMNGIDRGCTKLIQMVLVNGIDRSCTKIVQMTFVNGIDRLYQDIADIS